VTGWPLVGQAFLSFAVRSRHPPLPGSAGTHPDRAIVLVTAISSGVAAAIHASATGPHFEQSPLFAGAFAAMAVAQGGWMILIFVVPSRRRYLAGAWLNGAVVLIWLVSRTVGLPVGPDPWVAEPVGAMDATATLAELLAVVGSLVLAWRMDPDASRLSGPAVPPALIRVGFGLLVSGFAASLVSHASPGAHDFGSQACCGPVVGHLVIIAGMLATLAGVLTAAVRGGTRPQRRRTS
jgi:hypothetical protein